MLGPGYRLHLFAVSDSSSSGQERSLQKAKFQPRFLGRFALNLILGYFLKF